MSEYRGARRGVCCCVGWWDGRGVKGVWWEGRVSPLQSMSHPAIQLYLQTWWRLPSKKATVTPSLEPKELPCLAIFNNSEIVGIKMAFYLEMENYFLFILTGAVQVEGGWTGFSIRSSILEVSSIFNSRGDFCVIVDEDKNDVIYWHFTSREKWYSNAANNWTFYIVQQNYFCWIQ